ncbi:MAG: selenocysteine-specific translation elongation factor [Actinomycetota bacterium]|nr:selenocysteine-specific translation elongation factor [Actinomycetota bacterium]
MQVIGTAGHVDHGKSSLVEHLTGIDPDRFAEEKRRGLTIDLGFAWVPLPSGREIGIVDVPGHERFIKNMLAGAGGITVCLFVVAANEGWMPQSAEHLAIIDLLAVRTGVIALTKADTVDQEMTELVIDEINANLAGSSLEGAPIVPCSSVTGDGIDRLLETLDRVVASAPRALDLDRPRLWVDRVFTIAGAGTVVTGTLAGGSFEAGAEVEVAPGRRRARIRTVQSHKRAVERISPGNRVALNLAGLEREGAVRGDAIVRPAQWQATRGFDASIRVVGSARLAQMSNAPREARRTPGISPSRRGLAEKGSHLLYVGSAEVPVRLRLYGSGRLEPGKAGFAHLSLRDPLPIGRGDRFVVRDAGRVLTLAGGEVLDPWAGPARREDPARFRLLERLSGAAPPAALAAIVEAAGAIEGREAVVRAGHSGTGLPPGVIPLGRMLASAGHVERLHDALHRALERHHREHPLERGLTREAARDATEVGAEEFDALVALDAGVADEGRLVRLASHRVDLAPEQRRARDALIRDIESAGFSPPPAKELRADPALLRSLVESGELVKVSDFYLTTRQAQEARRRVRAHLEAAGPATVAVIRDLLGTSRKYAVPLCEWLDQTGATRRRGDSRVLGPTP